MLGSFLTRGLVLVFGYAYPAYECYKTVERNKPEIENLLFWCQYWILVASLTVFERVGDTFVSWVPMYSEAKLAFFIYLWYPKTKGTTYVYDSFFRPYIAKHENDIDRNLLELRTRAGDMAILYWQRAASYTQTRVFDILQFIASQSTPKPSTVQLQQQQGPATAALNRQPSKKVQLEEENKEPPSPASSVSSSQDQKEVAEVAALSNPTPQAPPKPSMAAEASMSTQTKTAEASESESLPIESTSGNAEPPKETIMEESLRRTRGRLRKTRSIPIRKESESTGC